MAIKRPGELKNTDKRVQILIAGFPGIGKSTLGLSAPAPLHIDVDHGLDRVPAAYRKDFIQPDTYEELLEDLAPENLTNYKTLVIDTGGKMIKLMSSWAIRQNTAYGQKDGSLSLKGYGAVGREFERLMYRCAYELKKNVVVLFHAKEDKDGDNTKLRLLVEGQTKDNVWQPMDLGGFVEINNNKRTIGFTNCERYFAKGTHGITGIQTIPELKEGTPNDFLTKLFDRFLSNITEEAKATEVEMEAYNSTMAEIKDLLDGIDTPKKANEAMKVMKKMEYPLTSYREAQSMFKARLKELGYVTNKEKGTIEAPKEDDEECDT